MGSGVDEPTASDIENDDYDEFQFLEAHARWVGLKWGGRPKVARDELHVDAHVVSYIRWGSREAELVLLHGAGQNSHTWDTLAIHIVLGDPGIVLKRSLLLIPFFGWYVGKTAAIPIDRGGGASTLRNMARAAAKVLAHLTQFAGEMRDEGLAIEAQSPISNL